MVDIEWLYKDVWEIEAGQNFKSYDVYDGATLQIPVLKNIPLVQLISTYVNKFSPVNLRPLLRIAKHHYPHAIGNMVEAYYRKPAEVINENDIKKWVQWLISKSLINKYGYHCWNGLDIPLRMRGGNQTTDIPGLIGTEAVTGALIEYYKSSSDSSIIPILQSVRSNLLDNYYVQNKAVYFFKYKPTTPKDSFTINASAKAISLLCKINEVLGEEDGDEKIYKSLQSVIKSQNSDGSWDYTIHLGNKKNKVQVDFHQAYILISLMQAWKYGYDSGEIRTAIEKGLRFHNKEQVSSDGMVFYRLPKKYPANIHNQISGYLCNSLASKILEIEEYVSDANNQLKWGIKNLYKNDVGFMYGKYPLKKIAIPYSRWGNGYFLLAISFNADKL